MTRLLRQDLAQHRLRRRAHVRRLAHQHLVQHAPQRVHVARRRDLPVPRRLLRAHVVRRPHAQTRLGQPRPARPGHRDRDPEVGDERLAAREQDVARLDVPVDHSLLVRDRQRRRHRRRDPHRLVHRKLLLPVDSVPKRLPLDVGHGEEEEAVGIARVEERQDVRVLQVRRRLDLGQEALGTDDGGELGLEHLQRDAAVVLLVARQVDRRHAALAELTLDAVAALEGRVQAGDWVGQEACSLITVSRVIGPGHLTESEFCCAAWLASKRSVPTGPSLTAAIPS